MKLTSAIFLACVSMADISKSSNLGENEGKADQMLYPDSAPYEARMNITYSRLSRLRSSCLVLPKTTQEVAKALTTLLDSASYPIGLRSGGHMSWAGSNYVENGVTIDFALMTNVSYDPTTNIASIQTGSNWSHVYETLQPYGVTVAGGRAGNVGVGGFMTGGGNNFFLGQHGFGCDTVVNFELVLANGSIVNANDAEHPDLWRALKGGHGNLGIVTRFDMRAIEYSGIFGGQRVYAEAASDTMLDVFTQFTAAVDSDPGSEVIMTWVYRAESNESSIVAMPTNVDGDEVAPALKGFMDSEHLPSSTMRLTTHQDIVDELSHGQRYGDYWANDGEMNKFAVTTWLDMREELSSALGDDSIFSVQVTMSPLPATLGILSTQNGRNLLGFERYDTPGVKLLVLGAIREQADEPVAREIIWRHVEDLKERAQQLGVHRDWVHINYVTPPQDPITAMGPGNAELLRAAARKYDPDGVFQKTVMSGFKLNMED